MPADRTHEYSYRNRIQLLVRALYAGKHRISFQDLATPYLTDKRDVSIRQEVTHKLDTTFEGLVPGLKESLIRTITRGYNTAESPAAQEALVDNWIREIDCRTGNAYTHSGFRAVQPQLTLVNA